MQDRIIIFINRLNKLGIVIEIFSNYPWVYVHKINGKPVSEKYHSEHGFTIAFRPVRNGEDIEFTDIKEIFKLIRKYV